MAEVLLRGADFAELSWAILRWGRGIRFRARGQSMFPMVRNGDVVIIHPTRGRDLRPGNVVLHRIEPGRLVAHRIVWRGVQEGTLLLKTRGDASLAPADLVRAGQVLGHVVAIQRGARLMRLDRGLWPLAGIVWARLWPIGPALMWLARSAGAACRWIGTWGKGRRLDSGQANVLSQ